MEAHAYVEPIRTTLGVVVAPVVVGLAGLAVGLPALATLGALAVAVHLVARHLGRERGAYAALLASAMFAGVYSTAHHGDASRGGPELLALGALLVVALVPARRRDVRSEVPDPRGVAAHDELALVGGDARELLVDQRS